MDSITHGSILAVFFTASQAEIEEGRQWYISANTIAKNIAASHRCINGCNTVAAVIAALSPNNRWHRNIIDAEALIKVHSLGGEYGAIKVSTYSKNKDKAIRILEGEEPLDVLGGNKVRAFYRCILGEDDVCVDGHAFSIWSGQRVSTTKTPKISDSLYRAIVKDYQKATTVINSITQLNYTASQIQAITWVTWRNLLRANQG